MIRTLFIFFFLASLPFSIWSAEEQFSDRLEGSQINTSAHLEVVDDKYPIMDSDPNWSDDFFNKKVINKIRLGLLPETTLTTDEDCEVVLDVDYREDDGLIQSFTCTLSVEYKADGTLSIKDQSTYVFEDAHVVQIEILSVTSGSINDFFLETTMEVERYYTFDGNAPSNAGVQTITNDDYIEFYWGSKYGAESYELEYIHVNNYIISGGTIPESALYYDFYNSATRIATDKLSYRIPNTFDKGYIVFRVRAIGRAGANYDKRYEGAWDESETGLISSISGTNKLTISTEYDATLNWSYQAAMSEEGKRMQGISFSDGLGRPRQQLMHNPETEQVVVSNTYYDYHGRPVIQDMGTPVDDEELKYYTNFNLSAEDQTGFGPQHFDSVNGGSCAKLPDAFDNSSGAGQYYSTNNSNIDGANHNIPDADGYPYSQIQYMPDQTGRIKRSGAFGDEHQIGNGHSTKYVYSTPTQEEINRLFGSEAGYAHQYQKRLMEDANGQYYITYYDLAGRVVASGLAGSAPSNLEAIDGETPLEDFQFNLLDSLSIEETVNRSNSISNTEAITITDDNFYTFSYDFEPEQYTEDCMDDSICFDCVYDIELLIVESECEFDTIYRHTIQLTGNDYDNICQDSIIDLDTLINLTAGDYSVTRTLSINQNAISEYWCSYVEKSECAPSYADIYNALYYDLTFYNCADIVFDPEDFDVAGDSRCDLQKQVLLSQLSPGGQYALYDIDSNGDVDASAYPLSIFNSSNSLPTTGSTWDNPVSTYLDEDGNTDHVITEFVGTNTNDGTHYDPQVTLTSSPDLIQVNNSNVYQTLPENLLNPKDFILRFKPSWAESLLDYHPEACYLDFCYDNLASERYNSSMDTVYTFSEACSLGFFNPLDISYTTAAIYNTYAFVDCFDNSAVDTFFLNGVGEGEFFNTQMTDSMTNFIEVGTTPTTIDIWTYAIFIAVFDGDDFYTNQNLIRNYDIKPCDADAIWTTYRSLYKQLKYHFVKQEELEHVMANDCYNGCIGENAYDSSALIVNNQQFNVYTFQGGGPAYDGSSDTDQPCSNSGDYADKQQVFFDYWDYYQLAQDTADVQDSLDQILLEQCQTSCELNADEWIADLFECPGVSQATLDAIKAELITICQSGCSFDGYPQGVSTMSSGTTSNGNSTFEEVLEFHLGTGYESDLCNFYLLDQVPPEFGEVDTSGYEVYLDDCGCDILMQAHHDFEDLSSQGNLPDGVENIEHMLAYNTGISLEDANQLLCECDKYYNGTLSSWTPDSWNQSNAAALLGAEIVVQPSLSCAPTDTTECLDCNFIDSVYSAFISEMESQGIYDVDTSANYDHLMSNYMNSAINFDLSAEDYLEFMSRCDATNEDPYCTINPEAQGWIETMDLLAKRGQLSATSTSPVDLQNDNIVYSNSAFGLNQGLSYFWSCEGGDCDDETLTVYFGENTSNSCSFTLNFPTGSSISNDQIIGFSDLKAFDASCADTNDFELLVEYLDCGEVQFATVTGSSDCINVSDCSCSGFDELLCNDPIPDAVSNPTPCYSQTLLEIKVQADDLYAEYMDTLYTHFKDSFNLKCREAYASEQFIYTGDYQMYQFTLFFYDQAGNLVRTVAPKGVNEISQTQNSNINAARDIVQGPNDTGTTGVFPTLEYVTEYHYNSYGQLTQTTNPDQDGNTNYWYDRYGRIIASQNPHQFDASKYSYTFYDEQGRPVQVGQVETIAVLTETVAKADDLGASFENWVSNGTRTEVTITVYDEKLSTPISNKFENGQQNLRLRVASILYFDSYSSSTDITTDYTTATHYSYDVHGNVVETLQDTPLMKPVEQDIKSTQYDYDLFSGNMNKVEYQKDEADQMTHEYHYDQLNRLSEVYTTKDGGIHMANDARYHYYDYGPLARVEIGEYQVQAMDYAYTINGWIKGANSNTLTNERGMGRDGYHGETYAYYQDNPNVHQNFAADSFGYSLNYFEGDYAGIGTNNFEADYTVGGLSTASSNLYNGNIRHMVTAISNWEINGYAYTYDQLQRLKKMELYNGSNLVSNNSWSGSLSETDYLTQISYDKNGNITNLERNGIYDIQTAMDDMGYNYTTVGGDASNRLDYVNDLATDNANYEDIKSGQTSGNYAYNKIGELTADASEDMNLTWRYGDHKLDEITRTDQSSPNIEFVYNPLGVRVAKIVKPRVSGSELSDDNWTVTYYAYDANGQLMATYSSQLYDTPNRLTSLEEQYIYGSKRLGVIQDSKTLYNDGVVQGIATNIKNNEIGHKRYELTNHLGNVMVTVSDRKVWNNTDSNYEPVIVTKSDFYPFGSLMPGRHEGLGDQRHLFNGMEADGEISGEGNSYTTEYRQYDPRLGRWKSLDPLMSMFPHISPYVAFANNPVVFTDPYGLAPTNGDEDGNGEGEPDKGKIYTSKHDQAETTIVGTDKSAKLEPRAPTGLDQSEPVSSLTLNDNDNRDVMTPEEFKQKINMINGQLDNIQEDFNHIQETLGKVSEEINTIENDLKDAQGELKEIEKSQESSTRVNKSLSKSDQVYDIDKAVKHLIKNAKLSSTGWCAKYVRKALEAGGLSTSGRPTSAKGYDTYLKDNKGFKVVTVTDVDSYVPQKGDIVVFEAKGKHKHGHIQMWSGTQWISDFKQKSFHVYSDKTIKFTVLRR